MPRSAPGAPGAEIIKVSEFFTRRAHRARLNLGLIAVLLLDLRINQLFLNNL